ncbi:MAG: GntR family transcriptional regulator [Paenibacillaceae bacterium]|nr:GntR family transcriptional regulator [Paenibacillaceae bacterium]
MKTKQAFGSLSRSFYSSDVLTVLRIKLVLGEIKAGDKLVELKIADEMNTSRGPVRNALFMLEKEGLVSFLPNGRTEAAGFSLDDLDHLYETRLSLEQLALESAFRKPAMDLTQIRMLNRGMRQEMTRASQFTQHDIDYHHELVALSGNKYLQQAWQSFRPVMETVLLITNSQIRSNADVSANKGYVLEHHQQITDALTRGDREQTLELLREHLQTGKAIMKEKMTAVIDGSDALTAAAVLSRNGLA